MKDSANAATHARSTFQASREAVRRAHERAREMQERSLRMREAFRHRRQGFQINDGELSRFHEQTTRAVREQQRFVAVVSHELRQPLNAAIAAMSLLNANASADASDRARVVLRRQLLHMSTLLDDLLDISRLALRTIRLERVRVDLRTTLQDAVDAINGPATSAGITVHFKPTGGSVPMVADPARLQQAFSNLLSNGVRYTPSGGSIHVTLTVVGSVALVRVADTGQGISAADLPNIFEPFWRGRDSSSDGFGIGLALVRGIIELHDGTVTAFSDGPGAGSQFTVTLPISSS